MEWPGRRLGCLLLTGALWCGMYADSAEDAVELTVKPEPVVVTEATREQGKRNVENVIEQLQNLLMPVDNLAAVRQARREVKPRFDIINGDTGRSTLIYQCRYNRAEWLANPLEIMLDEGYVEWNEEKNQIVVNDLSSKMPELEKALLAMDVPSPQVLLEARVVEFILTDGMQRNLSFMYNKRDKGTTGTGEDFDLDSGMGINPATQGPNPSNQGANIDWYPYISDSGQEDIKVAFQWLLTAQDAKLLSSPNLVISRNEIGRITTGQDLPIQQFNNSNGNLTTSTTYKRVGVKLEVEPCIINSNSVTLRIFPEVSNVAQYQRIVQNGATYQVPVITVRSIETELALENGQIVILGGLYDTRESLQEERTPFLSDLPFCGELFTSKATTQELVQLIFFLRVHILNGDDLDSRFSFDPEQVARETEALKQIFEDSAIVPPSPTTLDQVEQEFLIQPEKDREARAAAKAEAAAIKIEVDADAQTPPAENSGPDAGR